MARRRTNHKGVTVYNRVVCGRRILTARWVDPDTGKTKYESLAKLGIHSKVQANTWLHNLAQKLESAKIRIALCGPKRFIDASWEEIHKSYRTYFVCENGEQAASRNQRDWLSRWMTFLSSQKIVRGEDLLSHHLLMFREYLALSMPTISPNTRNRHLSAVKAMLSWARGRGFVNILLEDIQGKHTSLLKPYKVERKLPVVLSPEQLRLMLSSLVDYDNERFHSGRHDKHAYYVEIPSSDARPKYAPLATFVVMLMLTGARPGEILGLKWQDVHLDEGWARIHIIKSKTRQQRVIPLHDSPMLKTFLTYLRLRRGDSVHVCGDNTSGGPRTIRKDSWRRLMERASLEGITPKVLRSTCVSYVASGSTESEYLLESRFGHGTTVSRLHYRIPLHGIGNRGDTVEDWLGVRDELATLFVALGFVSSLKNTETPQEHDKAS